MYKRIVILGHAGRGKSTFAENLSKKLSIPHYSTDDFFYKVKFSEPNSKEESISKINEIYNKNEWIMEGTTSRLIRLGIEKADIVFVLKFRNIISQYYFIIKRHFSRDNESLKDLLYLLVHITKKRYISKHKSNLPSVFELKEVYKKPVIELHSIKEINSYLNSFINGAI
jgi:adenylate kinase family enzyme